VPVSDEVLDQARAGDRDAVEAVITESFPAVHRIAHAMTGDPVIASKVVRFVLRRGVSVMPRWRAGLIPENWFYHNTLITLRRLNATHPSPQHDLLITVGPTSLPAYPAFIRALRGLPNQQAEAFILRHGEQLNERLLGVAMDLSIVAATSHLAAATTALQTIAGPDYPLLSAAFEKAYALLTPPDTIVRTAALSEIRAVLWKKLLRRLARRLINLAILAAIAYAGWHWRAQLLEWFNKARAAATTRRS
jgi:DNA-directed RNA polymerase specialized sigma24 family protein